MPGDHPHPGIQPESLACPALAGRFFTTGSPGKPISQSGKAGQRSLVCCSPWGNKESDTTEQLNNIRQNTVNCRFSLILWNSPLFRVLLAQGKIGPLIVTWFMGKKGEAKSNLHLFWISLGNGLWYLMTVLWKRTVGAAC